MLVDVAAPDLNILMVPEPGLPLLLVDVHECTLVGAADGPCHIRLAQILLNDPVVVPHGVACTSRVDDREHSVKACTPTDHPVGLETSSVEDARASRKAGGEHSSTRKHSARASARVRPHPVCAIVPAVHKVAELERSLRVVAREDGEQVRDAHAGVVVHLHEPVELSAGEPVQVCFSSVRQRWEEAKLRAAGTRFTRSVGHTAAQIGRGLCAWLDS